MLQNNIFKPNPDAKEFTTRFSAVLEAAAWGPVSYSIGDDHNNYCKEGMMGKL